MVGTLVPTLATLLTNKTNIVSSVTARLTRDVLGQNVVHLLVGNMIQILQSKVSAQVQMTFTVILFQSLGYGLYYYHSENDDIYIPWMNQDPDQSCHFL